MNALKWRSPAAAALLAMLALGGCAAGADDDPDAESNPQTSGAEGESAETTADPEPTEEPPPSAADGTDYSNCDAQCEVEVTAGVVFEYETFTMTIGDVTEDGIEISRDDGAGSTGSASFSSGCVAYLSANGSGTTCFGGVEGELPEPQPADGEVAVVLLHATDGTAIIQLTVGS